MKCSVERFGKNLVERSAVFLSNRLLEFHELKLSMEKHSLQRGKVRHRTSSFFDLDEYNVQFREKHASPSLKGSFSLTHSELPDTTKHSEIADMVEVQAHHKRKTHVMQNTYQLDPKTLFSPSKVEEILKEELEFLVNTDYDADTARTVATDLANSIKAQIKPLFPRYKFVVQVTIGGKGHQGVKVVSKFFWDMERDNFASHTVTSRNLFAVATVYGIYFE